MTKECSKCGEQKALMAFHRNRRMRLGLHSYCKACARDRARAWGKANRDKKIANQAAYVERNREAVKARRAAEYKADRDAKLKKAAEYREANRERIREWHRAYDKANPGIANAKWAKRKAAKLQRTPAWADLAAIRAVYEACPPGHEVDHIIPLRGKVVSGLHVANNLQYLTPEENNAKGNRLQVRPAK